jgi:hypothetical protein
VTSGDVGRSGGRTIWRLTGEVTLADGPRPYDQTLVATADGAFELRTAESVMRADPSSRRILVDAPTRGLAMQLATTYGLPLLLEPAPSLVLHACAAVPPGADDALVVCASSGTGKSTLLVALLAAGWHAVSEDVSVIDLRAGRPCVWPGPPWLRRAGEGPPGAKRLFELTDETVWDISARQLGAAVGVSHIVHMQPAGGSDAVSSMLGPGEAIAALVGSAIYLSDPPRRAERTFARAARVASSVAVSRLRLPIAADWAQRAETVVRGAMARR